MQRQGCKPSAALDACRCFIYIDFSNGPGIRPAKRRDIRKEKQGPTGVIFQDDILLELRAGRSVH